MSFKKEYIYREFIRQEDNILRAPYNPELEFYSVIKSGNIEKTKELLESERLIKKQGLGKLSDDELQHYKYHLVITIAMIARYCIDGGMDVSLAYNLSDFYIQKTDKVKRLEDIDPIHRACTLDYTKRMRALKKDKICSLPVVKSIDYIYDHLHTKITNEELAEHAEVSIPYLCRVFKKETNKTISEYVQNLKIETAENMLIYSEYSPSEIASILAFPNQSYFTEVFRKHTGITPKKYRAMHLRETELNK